LLFAFCFRLCSSSFSSFLNCVGICQRVGANVGFDRPCAALILYV
jgi:hypothetical protein